MSDQQTPPQGDSGQSGQPTFGQELAHELRELGQTLEQAFRTVLQTDRAKAIQRDLANGFKEVGAQVTHALNTIQSNARIQELTDRGQQAVHQASDSKVVHDLQETIKGGLEYLNERLKELVDRLEADRNRAASVPMQQVPLESEPPPSTGPTVKLNPDEPQQ